MRPEIKMDIYCTVIFNQLSKLRQVPLILGKTVSLDDHNACLYSPEQAGSSLAISNGHTSVHKSWTDRQQLSHTIWATQFYLSPVGRQ